MPLVHGLVPREATPDITFIHLRENDLGRCSRLQLIWKVKQDPGRLMDVFWRRDSTVGDTSLQGLADCSPTIKKVDRPAGKY